MSFAERIRTLSPQQRARLLERLGHLDEVNSAQTEIAAYVVPRAGADLSLDALRVFCTAQLPAFMIPRHLVVLGQLPVHPNGKVNRSALPSPPAATAPANLSGNQPGNDIEVQLARIWADLLHLEKVGVQENFFGLGGHSLLALQVMARVREAFKIDLPLKALFEAPTVAGLAQAIARAGSNPKAIRKIGRRADAGHP